MQRRIERTVFHLQYLIGTVFNVMRDRVPVRRSRDQRLQDQEIERPLQHFTLERMIVLGAHGLHSTPIDDRPKNRLGTRRSLFQYHDHSTCTSSAVTCFSAVALWGRLATCPTRIVAGCDDSICCRYM